MTEALVTLVIPNRDGEGVLPACLDAVAGQDLSSVRTIVVDDASRDGSRGLVRTRYPWVELVSSSDTGAPQGFAAAVNTGLRMARGTYAAMLNADTEADGRWLSGMIEALDAAPDAAACAPRMVYGDGRTVNALGLGLSRGGVAGALHKGEPDGSRFDRACEVFGPSGGAALWRREALERVGLFEEAFFAYHEDADLALRARAAGYTCRYAPAARVVHYEARCPSLARADKVALRMRNAAWCAFANLPAPTLLAHLPRVFWETRLRYCLKYGPRPWKVEGRAFWRATGWLVRGVPHLVRMRRARQRARTVPPEALAAWLGRDPFAGCGAG